MNLKPIVDVPNIKYVFLQKKMVMEFPRPYKSGIMHVYLLICYNNKCGYWNKNIQVCKY